MTNSILLKDLIKYQENGSLFDFYCAHCSGIKQHFLENYYIECNSCRNVSYLIANLFGSTTIIARSECWKHGSASFSVSIKDDNAHVMVENPITDWHCLVSEVNDSIINFLMLK